MAKTIGEALRLLQNFGYNIASMNLDSNNITEHRVFHRFKERIIIPYIGIDRNVDFVFSKGEHYITTADNIRCKVINWSEKHICELEDEIRKVYNLDAWAFIKKWHKACPYMDSMHFLILDLKKEE